MITPRIDQFKAAPAAVGPSAPTSTGAKVHVVDGNVDDVGRDDALAVCAGDLIGHCQNESISIV
jgi:hypothetical protein